jgi:hypothetical protein
VRRLTWGKLTDILQICVRLELRSRRSSIQLKRLAYEAGVGRRFVSDSRSDLLCNSEMTAAATTARRRGKATSPLLRTTHFTGWPTAEAAEAADRWKGRSEGTLDGRTLRPNARKADGMSAARSGTRPGRRATARACRMSRPRPHSMAAVWSRAIDVSLPRPPTDCLALSPLSEIWNNNGGCLTENLRNAGRGCRLREEMMKKQTMAAPKRAATKAPKTPTTQAVVAKVQRIACAVAWQAPECQVPPRSRPGRCRPFPQTAGAVRH